MILGCILGSKFGRVETEPQTGPLWVVRQLATSSQTGLLWVVRQVETSTLTAPLQVLQVLTTATLVALLRVEGSGVTTVDKAHIMVNSLDGDLGTGYRVWFYYPFETATEEMGLRRPDLANADIYDPLIVRAESRGGTVNQFDRGRMVRGLQLSFRFLMPEMAAAAREFFNTARSAAIRYVDHNERTWKIYAADGALVFTEGTRDGTEDLALTLEVENAAQDG